MILGDAIKGIREWRGISNDSDIFSFIDSEVYSDIQILKILEYAGTLFLMLILGSQLKDQSSFTLSFDVNDTKLLNIGSCFTCLRDSSILSFSLGFDNDIKFSSNEFSVASFFK